MAAPGSPRTATQSGGAVASTTPAAQGSTSDLGAAAVEFALILPVLVLLIFAIVDFGRMLSTKIAVTEAAREGARAAAVAGPDEAADRVNRLLAQLGDGVTPTITGCGADGSGPDNNPAGGDRTDATVTVTYRFSFVTPVGLLFPEDHVDLVAEGVMPCLG
jgi:Flp pilus assembly protein TadG